MTTSRNDVTAPGAATPAVCNQINLIARDMDRTLAFYRALGLSIPDGPEWPPGSGARHTEVVMPSGFHLEFDNEAMAGIWHAGMRVTSRGDTSSVLTFALPSRAAVDALYAGLTALGAPGRHPPHDAFWGSRFAIVADPDGRDVGLMSPQDPAKRFVPEV